MAWRFVHFLPLFTLVALVSPAQGQNPPAAHGKQRRQSAGQVLKKPAARQIIKGKFKLAKILLEQDSKRQLWFEGRTAHGKALSLVLVSRYTHPDLRQGRSYQLAAEVGAKRPDYLLLNKALVFFPGSNGTSGSGGSSGGGTTIPVWIMADHANLSLDVEKYLKMHAPTSDYLVM